MEETHDLQTEETRRSRNDLSEDNVADADGPTTTGPANSWSRTDLAEAKRKICQGVPLDGKDGSKKATRRIKAVGPKEKSSSSSIENRRNEGSNSTDYSMNLVEAKRKIHNMRTVQPASSKEEVTELESHSRPHDDMLSQSNNGAQSQPGAHGQGRIWVNNDTIPTPNDNMPELVAEVVPDPVVADFFDYNKKLRKTMAIFVVACVAVIAIVVGGLCGSGGCGAESVERECELHVYPSVDVLTDTVRRIDVLTTSAIAVCEWLDPEVELVWNETTCPHQVEPCLEPPYKIGMLFNGGNCMDNKFEDGLDTLCQDGDAGTPPVDFDSTAYIRVTDLLVEDVIYFDDYVKVGDFFSLTGQQGSSIGPDILIQIFDSSEPNAKILQTVYYYSVCSNTNEWFTTFGAVQAIKFNFESQTVPIRNGTESLQVMVSARGPLKVLLDHDGAGTPPQITIDKVALFRSYAPPSEHTGVFDPLDEPQFGDGVLLATEEVPITWVANTTERISFRAEVSGTGPNGENRTLELPSAARIVPSKISSQLK